MKPAVALLREDGNEHQHTIDRQSVAITRYGRDTGFLIISELAFQGATSSDLFDSIAFRTLLGLLQTRRVGTIIVASGFSLAADPLVHTVAEAALRRHGLQLVAVEPVAHVTITASPSSVVNEVLALNNEFELRLSQLEERQNAKLGPRRRKNYSEMFPEAAAMARRMNRESIERGARRSLRELSADLAQHGHLNNAGKPYHPDEVRRMILGPEPVAIRQKRERLPQTQTVDA